MKKLEIAAGSVVALAVIIFVLVNNRSKMNTGLKSDLMTDYPVSIATVTRQEVLPMDPIVGTITANHDVTIVSEVQGKITAVKASVGDYVDSGATILQVDDELKQAALSSAEVNYEKSKKDLERFESLLKQNSVTDEQYESARFAFKSAEAQYITAKRQYHDTRIASPISGVVSMRTIDVGEYVQNGTVVANVVDLSILKVKVNVSEKDVFLLKPGDEADISTDVYSGVVFKGKIKTIGSKADEAHTYPVEVTLPNSKEHPLKAGMFGTVAFHPQTTGAILCVPRVALLGSLRQPQIYAVVNGIAKLKTIAVGREFGLNVEVLDGLSEGETIVVNGQDNLKDNIAVTIVK
jgi:RND family efflux transporter MFP subunit